MRLFIAIELSSEIKKKITELIKVLKEKGEGVKWVNPEGMHLTLKFLGETPQSKIKDLTKSIDLSLKEAKSFNIYFKGTGCFPSGRKPPRVFWIGILENETLKKLQNNIEIELEKIGFPRERREFIPHLTLGRVKFPSKIGTIKNELEKYRNESFGEMRVKKITLFQSILRREGAEYIPLANFNLK